MKIDELIENEIALHFQNFGEGGENLPGGKRGEKN